MIAAEWLVSVGEYATAENTSNPTIRAARQYEQRENAAARECGSARMRAAENAGSRECGQPRMRAAENAGSRERAARECGHAWPRDRPSM